MLKSLKDDGKMTVVLPQGVLFRGQAEGKIRKKIIDNDYIETVIGLGEGLFYGTGISTSILVFNKKKDETKKNKIQVIDASEIYKKDRSQNYLESSHVEEIYNLYKNYEDVEGKCRVVDISEIKEENEYNLNIALYVDKVEEDDGITLEQAYNDMIKAYEEATKAEEELKLILKEMGVM